MAMKTFIMKDIMLRAIFEFFNAEFVCSIDKYQPLQWCENGFWTGRGQSQKTYMFHFALKLPSICINHKCSMGVGSLHIL